MRSEPRTPTTRAAKSTGRELEPLAAEACQILRSEMVRRGISFRSLAEQLNARGDGPEESVQTLINKVNRGRFSFAFLLRCCRAMDVTLLGVEALDTRLPAGEVKSDVARDSRKRSPADAQ